MAKLTTTQRKDIPRSDYGLPYQKKYPEENKSHAIDAKARATQEVKAGKLSSGQEKEIDAKANRVIKGGK